MRFMQDTDGTEAWQPWWMRSVVALARGTITRAGLPLSSVPRAPQGAATSPRPARRTEPLPFADTEATWHPL